MADTQDLIVRLTMENGQFNAAVVKSDKALKRTEKSSNKLLSSVKKLRLGYVAVAGVITGVIGKALGTFVKRAADFEQLNVSFRTFLGSAKEATKVIGELNKFSRTTPFTPDQVNNAGKALLAFGVTADELIPSLRRIGDISAATGKDFNELSTIFGKAKTQGTLFAEDINQLTEAGVPIIAEFAKQFGVAESEVKKLGSEGKITFDNLEKGFESLTSEGGKFFNLTAQQSQTFSGRLSTLQGQLGEVARSIGQSLLPVAGKFVDFISRLIPEGEKASEALSRQNTTIQAQIALLKDSNLNQETRERILKDVNKQLKAQNIEQLNSKSSLDDLNTAAQKSNDIFLERIKLAAQSELIEEKQKEAFNLAKDILELEDELVEKQADYNEKVAQGFAGQEAGIASDKIESLKKQIARKEDLISKINEEISKIREKASIVLESDKKEKESGKKKTRTLLELNKGYIDKLTQGYLKQDELSVETLNKILEDEKLTADQRAAIQDELANRQASAEEQKRQAILKTARLTSQTLQAGADLAIAVAGTVGESDKARYKQAQDLAKGAFFFSKAVAAAELAIGTILGIAAINRDITLPTVAKPPLIAGVIASGVAGAATIAAQTISGAQRFEQGGLITGLPGGGPGNEDGIIAAQNGESVLNRQATAILGEDAINALNRGQGIQPTVNINVSTDNGNEVVDTLNDYFKSFGGSRQLEIG